MSFTDAVNRIDQIQAQIAAFNGAAPAPDVGSSRATATGATARTSPVAGASLADALAQAQGPSAAASGRLTPGQQQFASRLAQRTGLDPQVIGSWLLAEGEGGGAKAPQAGSKKKWVKNGHKDF